MEIISKTPITELNLIVGIAVGILAIVIFCIISDVFDNKWWMDIVMSVICIFISVAVGMIFRIETGRYEYEVVLTEDISAVELLEKYEVVGQRGEVYIIQDKEE